MDKPKKSRRDKNQGAPGVLKSPYAVYPKELPWLTHGLYRAAKLDMRTRAGIAFKGIYNALLERFTSPAPVGAQVIAQRCAVKLVKAISFEVFYMSGGKTAPNADRDYLALTGSIRADVKLLHEMAQAGPLAPQTPTLAEYLAALKAGQEDPPAPGPAPGPEPVKAKKLF
jgi:hypothetical protein